MAITTLLLLCLCAAGQVPCYEGPKNDDTMCLHSFTTSRPLPTIDLLHMPSPYSYQHLGFFCKAEVKLNQLLPIPVMFRLGDVQRAEELDGKGGLHPER